MVKDDPPLRRALGPRCPDEVLVQHLEHPAAGEPRDRGGVGDAQHDGRQHAVRGTVPARGVEPAEMDGEGEHEQRPDHEGRNRDARHAEGRRRVVDPSVAADGRKSAERDADEQRERERERAELGGDRELVGDDLVDGAVGVLERRSQVALDETAEIIEVLFPERLVEPVMRLEVAQDLRGHRLLRRERTTGHESNHEERRRDDEEQREQRLQEARRDETKHGSGVRWQIAERRQGGIDSDFPGSAAKPSRSSGVGTRCSTVISSRSRCACTDGCPTGSGSSPSPSD